MAKAHCVFAVLFAPAVVNSIVASADWEFATLTEAMTAAVQPVTVAAGVVGAARAPVFDTISPGSRPGTFAATPLKSAKYGRTTVIFLPRSICKEHLNSTLMVVGWPENGFAIERVLTSNRAAVGMAIPISLGQKDVSMSLTSFKLNDNPVHSSGHSSSPGVPGVGAAFTVLCAVVMVHGVLAIKSAPAALKVIVAFALLLKSTVAVNVVVPQPSVVGIAAFPFSVPPVLSSI